MSKIKMTIWNRDFELPIIVKQFKGKVITDVQKDAVSTIDNLADFVNVIQDEIEKYILDDSLKENGIEEVDNIFKYVMPKSIYVPKSKQSVVALICNYKFDMEHGLAIVFENEKFKEIGPEEIVL